MRRIVSWLTEFSYRKSWLVILVILVIAGYGAYTFTRVNQELIPDIEFPVMTLVVQSPGDQPDQVAQNVIAPIEAATAGLDGLQSTESTSVAGFGVILYSFEFGTNIDDAKAAVQEQVSTVPLGPGRTTSILTFDPSILPVVTFDLQGEMNQAGLTQLAQGRIIPELSNLDGVASVELVGGTLNQAVITLDREALLEQGITYDDVASALQSNNVILPSGQLETGNSTLPLQTVSLFDSVEELQGLPITAADGSLVPLNEIATIEQAEGTSVGRTRTNGEPSVSVRVTKLKSANTVDVAHAITGKLDEIEAELPDGISIQIFENQANFIEESINGVIKEGIIGGVLAIIIVFLFLWNIRSTFITAVSIPLSVTIAIIALNLFGNSLNIMTLAGLTIAIGRVIDDSIVVLENVYRHMAEGEPPFAATINGAREVTLAIVGATATTCAVFLPLGLIGGLIGELFLPFALAVVFALLGSLIVAVTVIPMLTKYTIAGRVKVEPEKKPGDTRLGRIYTPMLTWALRNRWKTVIVAAVAFIASFALVPFLKVAFLPDTSENAVTISVSARPGQTQQAVLDQSIQVEALLEDYDIDRYQTVITGASGDFGAIGAIIGGENPNSATMTVFLKASEDKGAVANELRVNIANEIPDSSNISVSASGGGFGPSSGILITVSANSAEGLAALPDFAQQVADAVSSVDNVANVSSNLGEVQDTVQIDVDASLAAKYGLTPADISAELLNLSSAKTVTTVSTEFGPIPIVLQTSGGDATTIAELESLRLTSDVTLGEVATLSTVPQQVTITRVDGNPAASVTADITTDDTGGVSAEVQTAVQKLNEPNGLDVSIGGVAGDIQQGFADMFIAIIISIVLVYTIMALLFGSWLDPLVILFSLPLAAIGAIVALFVTGTSLSISALIGVLMLVGIVVTNAIVMLEFVIMLRKDHGYSTHDALVEGAQTRLRPILMTAFAAMLALVPLSLGFTEGALIAADLGRTVIGGLFTSTLLTLVVVPVIYSLVDDLKVRVGHSERVPDREPVLRTPSDQPATESPASNG